MIEGPQRATPQGNTQQSLVPRGPQQPSNTFQDQQQSAPRQNRIPPSQPMQNRGGYNGGGGYSGTRGGQQASNTRPMPPKSLSRNPYVSGSVVYKQELGPLCIQCGEIGHAKPRCSSAPLEWWEQSYLKELLWPAASSNFAGFQQQGSGLRFREVGDSQWANRRPQEQDSHVAAYSSGDWRNQGADSDVGEKKSAEYDTPTTDLHQFMGREYVQSSQERNKCLSVVLGFTNAEEGRLALDRKGKRVKFEEVEPTTIALDAYLNETDQKKRPRPMDIESLINQDGNNHKFRKAEQKKARRTLRQLREIFGRQGKGPIDYKKLAEQIKVEVSLMDLFQISPDLSKAFRALSTRVNERQKRSKEPRAKSAFSVQRGRRHKPRVTIDQKAFRIPVVVKTQKNNKAINVTLPTDVAQADQGSDMTIITVGFLKALNIPMIPLSNKGFNGMTMNVADGTSAQLTHYATIEIGVLGIWRKVEAFVKPFGKENEQDIHLLLGLPWLHAVDAKIRIRDSIIKIGDSERGETVVKIKGPKFIEGEKHRLVLCPVDALELRRIEDEYDDESSDESQISDADSEGSSQDEGFGDLFESEDSGN
ncbi:hypothetical protein K3495_g1061 [Podosphaera aphanis]|nr:hypothetical protein K3495_g1061 [Podosphaera aphanis]